MVLINEIRYFNSIFFSQYLPEKIAIKFKNIKLLGLEVTQIGNIYRVTFNNGIFYDNSVLKITGKTLYNTLWPNELREMYEEIKHFIDGFENIDEINNSYKKTPSLYDWTENLSDQFIPSPNQIISLKELFKICYENNLQLYAIH
jgi:hypothetical protein